MRFQRLQALFLTPLLAIVATLAGAQEHHHTDAQPHTQRGDPAYLDKRQPAMQLFDQGKRLEALPLLEELVKMNTGDEEVVVALAASLVSHAASLSDQQAAGQERMRARGLLEKSGSVSPLAQNLLQLLREMPISGDIHFSENPEVEQAMRSGEAAFSQRNFDEAIKNYSKALELEPKNYAAVLFIGNTFYKKGDFAKAGEWYEKAIQVDPNIETAYRYYAEMLAREGDMAKSRSMIIHAAVAEPYNRMVWRDLRDWATINHTELNFVSAGIIPASKAPKEDAPVFEFKLFPDPPKSLADARKAYDTVRADWKRRKFKQHFPQEPEYRHSLAEETEALTAEIEVLEKLKGNIDTAEPVTENQSLQLLLQLHQAGLLEAYVLFRLGDEGIAKDYPAYRDKNRGKLEEFLDKFIVPSAPANANAGTARTTPPPK